MSARLVRTAVGAVVLLLVMSACQVASHVVVEPDGSGTYTVLITLPDADGDPGHELYETLRAKAAESPVPLPVERYERDGQSGAEISYDFVSLEDLRAEAGRLQETGAGLGGIEVHRDDAGWHFDAASDDGLVSAPGYPTGPPGGDIDPSRFASAITVSVVVQLPGAPAESNATAVTHDATTTTFTWALPAGREATPLQAATTFVGDQAQVPLAIGLTKLSAAKDDSSSSATGIAVGAVAAVVVIAGAVVVVVRRRTRRSVTTGG